MNLFVGNELAPGTTSHRQQPSHHAFKPQPAIIVLLLLILTINGLVFVLDYRIPGATVISPSTDSKTSETYEHPSGEYALQQVVVFARHSIRSPFSSTISLVEESTPYSLESFPAEPGHLTEKGKSLASEMGSYTKDWLTFEKLFTHTHIQDADAIRIYSNGRQRTLDTTYAFTTAAFPGFNLDIETHVKQGKMDPAFRPKLTFMSRDYEAATQVEAKATLCGYISNETPIGIQLRDSIDTIANQIDFKSSLDFKQRGYFDLADTQISLELDTEPALKGSIHRISEISDYLILGIYEFGENGFIPLDTSLQLDDLSSIGFAKDSFLTASYSPRLIAINAANPLLREIESEFEFENRKFTYICGHDSNMVSMLAALGIRNYRLPNTLEQCAPICSMICFERWRSNNGDDYFRLRMVYPSLAETISPTLMAQGAKPMSVVLKIPGLRPNHDGMYHFQDFHNLLSDTIKSFENLKTVYAD